MLRVVVSWYLRARACLKARPLLDHRAGLPASTNNFAISVLVKVEQQGTCRRPTLTNSQADRPPSCLRPLGPHQVRQARLSGRLRHASSARALKPSQPSARLLGRAMSGLAVRLFHALAHALAQACCYKVGWDFDLRRCSAFAQAMWYCQRCSGQRRFVPLDSALDKKQNQTGSNQCNYKSEQITSILNFFVFW